MFTIGQAEGDSTAMLGFVADAAFGPGGSIFVADAGQQRIVVYDSNGHFVRSFGRSGQGPGEFLDPSSLTLYGDTLFVYDSRQGRITVLDTAGVYQRAVAPPSTFVRHLRADPEGRLLLTIAADSFLVSRVTSTGKGVQRYIPRPAVESSLAPEDTPEPGPVCTQPDGFVYANPWLLELVKVDAATGREVWGYRQPSRILRPITASGGRSGTVTRGGGMLGLVCTDVHLFLGYLDLQSGIIHYDVFSATGEPLARLEFRRDGEPVYPGFVADGRGTRILAFRTRPYPQVSVWDVETGPASP
ncbi:MAG: 6-bladed beta-propeller [Gemmatimonadota bacterium]|nr:6-bladed beta-propeller [Gemmatimonadota bacterium]